MIGPQDDFFTHQIVAPHASTLYPDERWGERCFFQVGDPNRDAMVVVGRQFWPWRGHHYLFAGVRLEDTQVSIRNVLPYAGRLDEEPAGPLEVRRLNALAHWKLQVNVEDVHIDLMYEARLPPFETARNVIVVGGETVTDYMNFFQSGRFTGSVSLDGREIDIDSFGFRDRGWGIRKHEGSPRRGLVVLVTIELPSAVLYVLLYEKADGTRVFTSGALVTADSQDPVTGCEHDLRFQHGVLHSGELRVELDSGKVLEIRAHRSTSTYLRPLGYSNEPRTNGLVVQRNGVGPDDDVSDVLGETEHECRFEVTGLEQRPIDCYGMVETGVGAHDRYRLTQ